MTDYVNKVAEAVRDACSGIRGFLPKNKQGLVDNMIDGLNLETIIASVPRPEPVAWLVVNGGSRAGLFKTAVAAEAYAEDHQRRHDLSGSLAAFRVKPLYAEPVAAQPAEPGEIDCSDAPYMPADMEPDLAYRDGWNACRDAMLAAAPEAPQVAVQDRRAEACLTAMDHISTETLESLNRAGIKFDATRGYTEELEAEITTLREQNAALVAALEGVLRWIDHWAQTGPGMDFERVEAAADAALACVKGGAV